MRRATLSALGLLELAVAALVVALAVRLPNREVLSKGFERVRIVGKGASAQVELLREQVDELRQQDFTRLARELRRNAHAVASTLQNAQIDFQSIEALAEALGGVAKGLDGWAQSLDGDRLKKLSDGLSAAADYLENNVMIPANNAADSLEQSVSGLERDARKLAAVLQKAPPDLKAMREMHDSLEQFDHGLAAMARLLKFEHYGKIRSGFTGMETSLSTTADQVDKLSGFTYPVVKLNGFRAPDIEMKAFWAEGPKVADGLRKAVTGVQAASKQMDDVDKELPALRTALDESRKALGSTRGMLGKTLEQQKDIEALLKSVPERSAALAETLPDVGRSFSKMLRQTESFKEVAAALRQGRKLLDESAVHWPQLARAMKQSAVVLHGTQQQLKKALGDREQYEQTLQSSAELAKVTADLLPILTDRLDARLGQQGYTLEQMGHGLKDMNDSLPDVQDATHELVGILRWLLWLIAALIGLHGLVVVVSSRIRFMNKSTCRAAQAAG